jgi:hypothetical protein
LLFLAAIVASLTWIGAVSIRSEVAHSGSESHHSGESLTRRECNHASHAELWVARALLRVDAMRIVVSLVVLASLARVAAAEPPEVTPQAAEPITTVELPSYRSQTRLADGAALAIAFVAVQSESGRRVGAAVALGTYLLAAPIVHLAHDHSDRAVTSFALRAGLPLLGGLVGNAIGKAQCSVPCDSDAGFATAALGALTGAITASAIDIVYLSRGETVTRRRAPRWSPSVATGPNGELRAGIGGTF